MKPPPFPKKCPWERGDGKHYIALLLPDDRASKYMPEAFKTLRVGGVCNRCFMYDPTPRCQGQVTADRWGSQRCFNSASYHEQEWMSGKLVGPMKWFCKTHAPSVRREKARVKDVAWRLKWEARDKRHADAATKSHAERETLAEVIRWLGDEEAVGEEVCDDCEHHSCRMVRTARAYRSVLGALGVADDDDEG